MVNFKEIPHIIDLLQAKAWVGCGEYIERAKGRYEMPRSWKEVTYKLRRAWQLQK